MKKSKRARERARDEAESNERLRFKNYFDSLFPSSPPPKPTWTPKQISDLDKMESMLDRLWTGNSENIHLLSEFLSFSHYFERSSMRIFDLERKEAHYRTLTQPAAKAKLWGKIHNNFLGLKHELDSLRRTKDRGGDTAQ